MSSSFRANHVSRCQLLAGGSPATEIFLHGDLESGLLEGRTDEASTVHGRSDHRGAEGARGRGEDGGSGAQARRLRSNALQLEVQVRRHGCLRGQTAEAARGRERQAEEAFGRADVGCRRASRASVKKMVGPAVKREGVAHLRATMGLSERRACSIVSADRKMVRYRSCRPPDTELRTQLRDLANERKRFGYRRLFVLLRQEGEPSGINRIYRLYREEGLMVRKRRARRRAVGSRAPILVESKPNARWSVDFVHDQFACGRRFRILNIVDEVTRECLAAIPDTSISGRRVARELTALIKRRGKPGMIVSDNGTEFTSNAMFAWAHDNRVVWHFIARESRCRTASVRASTAGCGTSFSGLRQQMHQDSNCSCPAETGCLGHGRTVNYSIAERQARGDPRADRSLSGADRASEA